MRDRADTTLKAVAMTRRNESGQGKYALSHKRAPHGAKWLYAVVGHGAETKTQKGQKEEKPGRRQRRPSLSPPHNGRGGRGRSSSRERHRSSWESTCPSICSSVTAICSNTTSMQRHQRSGSASPLVSSQHPFRRGRSRQGNRRNRGDHRPLVALWLRSRISRRRSP